MKTVTHHILKHSERFLKTDVRYLASGTLWLSITQGVTALCGLALAMIFARHASAEVYGNYRFITTLAGIFVISSLSGMGAALIQSVSRGNEAGFMRALLSKIRWGTLGLLASILCGAYYASLGNYVLAGGFFLIAPLIPFHESLSLYTFLLQGRKRFDLSTTYYSLSQIIGLGALATAIITEQNLSVILLAYFIPWLVTQGLFTLITLRQHPLNTQEDPSLITTGKHFSLMNILPIAAAQLDKVFVFVLMGPGALATYLFATIVPEQVKMVLKNLQAIIVPKFSNRAHRDIYASVAQKIAPSLIILGVLTGVYWISVPYFYTLLFPQYGESVMYSQIYALSFLGAAITLPLSMLQAKVATRALYTLNTANSLVLIALMFLGTLYAGLWGAVAGRVGGELLNLAFALIVARRTTNTRAD